MTIGRVVDKILKFHVKAVQSSWIRKPVAWSVYQTWKWVDEHEQERTCAGDVQDP